MSGNISLYSKEEGGFKLVSYLLYMLYGRSGHGRGRERGQRREQLALHRKLQSLVVVL